MNKYGLLVLLISFVIVLTVILLITDHDNNLIIKVGAALISAVVVQQVVEKVVKNAKRTDEQKQQRYKTMDLSKMAKPPTVESRVDPIRDPELFVDIPAEPVGPELYQPPVQQTYQPPK